MRAIILDNRYSLIEELKGSYRNGVFKYKRNSFLGLTGSVEEIDLDYQKLIPITYHIPILDILFGESREKIAFYMYDGKNLNQLSLHELQTASSVTDYNQEWALGRFAEEATLGRRPNSFIDNLPWILTILVTIVAVIAISLVSNSASHNITTSLQPLNKIADVAQGQASICEAQLNGKSKVLNRTLIVLGAAAAKNLTLK